MSDADRRSSKRVTYFAEAQFEGLDASRQFQVRLADVSVGGAFVDTRSVLPAGTMARLKFTLMGRELSVQAEVRYSMPSFGMGVRFLDLNADDRALIEEFIRQRG
jgi:hypothetical protein